MRLPAIQIAAYITIAMCSILCLTAIDVDARIWHVRPDQSGDAATIQGAIDSSSVGDTILVAAGDYSIDGEILCSHKNYLTIQGERDTSPVTVSGVADRNSISISFSSNIILKGFVFSNCELNASWSGPLVIEDNVFKNLSPVATEGGGNIEIRNNVIYSCGTGIYCMDYGTNIAIHNNVIAYNQGTGSYSNGCGILLDAGSFMVYNNIITNNTSGIFSIATTLSVSCNDVWGNQTFNYDLTYVPDPTGTNGNISLDPQFCGAAPDVSGNFFLQSDSPCAPGNHPDAVQCGLIGRYAVGCGPTTVEKKSWGKIKSMFR